MQTPDKTTSADSPNTIPPLFLAICTDDPRETVRRAFQVYAVNNSDEALTDVAVKRGGFCGLDDDGVLKIEGLDITLISLPPRSWARVDSMSTEDLDFINFYDVVYRDAQGVLHKSHHSASKYEPAWADYYVDLPILNRRGYRLSCSIPRAR